MKYFLISIMIISGLVAGGILYKKAFTDGYQARIDYEHSKS
jgi:hypothetical protein